MFKLKNGLTKLRKALYIIKWLETGMKARSPPLMYFIYIYSTYIYKGLSVVSTICTCMKKSYLLFLPSIADKWTTYINYAVVISHSSLFIPSSSYLCYTLLYSFYIIQYHLSNGRDCWPLTGEMVSQCAFAKCCKRHLGKLQDDGQYSFAIGLRVIYCTNLQTVYFPRGLPLA